MATLTLAEFIENDDTPVGVFKPCCEYSQASDALNIFLENVRFYDERLSEHMTLFRAIDDDRLVGCRVKGVKGICESLDNYVEVKHDGIALTIVFLHLRSDASEEEKPVIDRLAQATKKAHLKLEPIC